MMLAVYRSPVEVWVWVKFYRTSCHSRTASTAERQRLSSLLSSFTRREYPNHLSHLSHPANNDTVALHKASRKIRSKEARLIAFFKCMHCLKFQRKAQYGTSRFVSWIFGGLRNRETRRSSHKSPWFLWPTKREWLCVRIWFASSRHQWWILRPLMSPLKLSTLTYVGFLIVALYLPSVGIRKPVRIMQHAKLSAGKVFVVRLSELAACPTDYQGTARSYHISRALGFGLCFAGHEDTKRRIIVQNSVFIPFLSTSFGFGLPFIVRGTLHYSCTDYRRTPSLSRLLHQYIAFSQIQGSEYAVLWELPPWTCIRGFFFLSYVFYVHVCLTDDFDSPTARIRKPSGSPSPWWAIMRNISEVFSSNPSLERTISSVSSPYQLHVITWPDYCQHTFVRIGVSRLTEEFATYLLHPSSLQCCLCEQNHSEAPLDIGYSWCERLLYSSKQICT